MNIGSMHLSRIFVALTLVVVACTGALLYSLRRPRLLGESLWEAVRNGDLQSVRQLLAQGASPDYHPAGKAEPARIAIRAGRTDIAVTLIDAGAATPSDLYVCLAIQLRDQKLLSELVKRSRNLDAPCDSGGTSFTPLMWAAEGRNREAVRMLLQSGAKVNKLWPARGMFHNETALTRAITAQDSGTALMLLKLGADPHVVFNQGRYTTLMLAANSGDVALVRELLRRKVAIGAKDAWGTTALWYADLGYSKTRRKEFLQIKDLILQASRHASARP